MAKQIIFNKQVDSDKSYIHVRRIKDFPKLVLSHQVGHRNQFFQSKVSNDDQESTLSLVLYPGGYDPDHSDYVAIRASLDQEIDCKIIVDIAICGRENEERFKRRMVLIKENHHRDVVKDFVGKSDLLNSADLVRDNDLLKIACRISLCYNKCEQFDSLEYHETHMDQFAHLFETGDFSDFKLTAGDKTFNIHKCILATHSPVFAAMFHNEMSEKNQSSADIVDIDADVLRELLRFIYVAKVDQLKEFASELWIAADKYQVKGLKEICEVKLIEMLSVDNIVENLLFLDKFNTLSKLKAAVIQCIIDNAEVLLDNDTFKNITKTLSSDLLSDVLCVTLKKTTVRQFN